jgi:hypothetical protein
MALNQVVYLQVEMANLFMERHNLTPDEFLALDKKYDVLGFIGEGYEAFHLTGSEGVLSEINEYVQMSRASRLS